MQSSSDIEALVRDADPARSHTPADELDELVRQAAAIAATARPAKRRPRRAWIAVPAAAAVLLAAAPAVLDHTSKSGGLAAKAYAATNPGESIIHEVAIRTWDGGNGPPGRRETRETWWRASDGAARAVTFTSDPSTSTIITVDSTGVVRITSPYLSRHTETDGGDSTTTLDMAGRMARSARGLTFEFRDLFPADQLQEQGVTKFDGRTVNAYSYHGWLTFYIVPATAQLVGSREAAGNGPDSGTVTTVIETYEKLPATPENIEKLR